MKKTQDHPLAARARTLLADEFGVPVVTTMEDDHVITVVLPLLESVRLADLKRIADLLHTEDACVIIRPNEPAMSVQARATLEQMREAFVPAPPPPPLRQIAERFAHMLATELGDRLYQRVREQNRHEPDGVCASMDFCDADQIMMRAMGSFGLTPYDANGDVDRDMAIIFNEAWDLAKREFLTAGGT